MKLLLILTILLTATLGGADAYGWVTLFLAPVTAIVGWIAGRRGRNNSTLHQLQETIDMLVKKNSELYAQITEQNKTISKLNEQLEEQGTQLAAVRRENAELKTGQERISNENAGLKRQLEAIKKMKK